MKKTLILLAAVFASGCFSVKPPPISSLSDEEAYTLALQKAAIPFSNAISSTLTPINAENKKLIRKTVNGQEYILTISLKSKQATEWYKNDPDGFYNTGNFQIWVTVVPDLKERIQALKPADVQYRLKQLLGLPPNAEYAYIVEFWVKPEDLFRPCPDREVSDNVCGLDFPVNTPSEYKKWFNDSRIERYYAAKEVYRKYPWTQLGYTYDWDFKSKTPIGMSEFVVDVNKKVIVGDFIPLAEYFK